MNNVVSRFLSSLSLGLLALALVAGSPAARAQAAPDLAASGMNDKANLGNTPYEKRAEFASTVAERIARLDARIAELVARPSTESAGEARNQAMDAVKSARADLEEKLGAISPASAETWVTVRDQVLGALKRTEAACERASAA